MKKHPTDLLTSDHYYPLIIMLIQLGVLQWDIFLLNSPFWYETNKAIWPNYEQT